MTAAHAQQSRPESAEQSAANAVGTAITQAQRLAAAAQYDDALKTLDDALKANPRDPRLRFTYGLVLSDQGKPREAADVFTQLTQDYPELPEPYNNLAVLRAAGGELEQAKLALDGALRALPTYSVAHENLGDVYLRLAVRSYEQAQKTDGGNATAVSKLTMARELLARIAPKAPAASEKKGEAKPAAIPESKPATKP